MDSAVSNALCGAVSTYCFHPKRKPTISLETDTVVIHYHSAIIMLLSIHLSIGAFLHCTFLSFFRLCNHVLLSLHRISFHCIIFVRVCCMMFNKVSVSITRERQSFQAQFEDGYLCVV